MLTRFAPKIVKSGGRGLLALALFCPVFSIADDTYISGAALARFCSEWFRSVPKALDRCLEALECEKTHGNASSTDGDAIGKCQSEYTNQASRILLEQQDRTRFDATSDGQPTTSGTPGAGALSVAEHSALACVQATEEAKNFCTDPIKYSSDGEINIGSRENIGMVTNLMMVGVMAGNMSGGKGTESLCNMMKTVGTGVTGLNATFAARCASFIGDCETKCEEAKREAEKLPADDQSRPTLIAEADGKLRTCRAQRSKQSEMASGASQSFMAAQMGRLCQQAAQTVSLSKTNPPPNEFMPGPANCATDSSNPLCRNIGGDGTGSGAGIGFSGSDSSGSGVMDGAGSNDFNVADLNGDPGQAGRSGGAAGEASKNAGVPGGGGGMLGGGSDGMGGDDDKGVRGHGKGYDTNVLQGERGGGGSVVAMPVSGGSGGWGGYGGGSETERRAGIDFSKFLPGQKNGPVRGPAGLNRASAEVGPMHEDIFKKISDRVRVVCKTNRLRDCN